MKTDDFEKRLQRQSQREIPGIWREEILAKAQESVASVRTPHAPRSGFFYLMQNLLSRPQRMAWAGLGAAWIVILALHLAAGENPKNISMTGPVSPVTPETLQVLKQQRLLFAELVERPVPRDVERNKTTIPGPRSQRRETIRVA